MNNTMYKENKYFPDVFKGCKHDCVYCLVAGTLVLMSDFTWKKIEDVNVGEKVVGFDEFVSPDESRRLIRSATVLGIAQHPSNVLKIQTLKGSVECSTLHPWLIENRWRNTAKLKKGDLIRWLSSPVPQYSFDESEEYTSGYLCGAIRGDGCLTTESLRFAVRDEELLCTVYGYLLEKHISARLRQVNLGVSGDCLAVVTNSLDGLKRLNQIIQFKHNPDYMRGFLAGIFDAKGSH